jgi:hypothetical protein
MPFHSPYSMSLTAPHVESLRAGDQSAGCRFGCDELRSECLLRTISVSSINSVLCLPWVRG